MNKFLFFLFFGVLALFPQKTTAATKIATEPKNVNFSDEYIKENIGKVKIEIPEVHELANIIIAISNVGQQDTNMIDRRTFYHAEVMRHFLPFKSHPVMTMINKNITDGFSDKNFLQSYWYYYAFKMNACGYIFNKNDSILDDKIIYKMGFSESNDPIRLNKNLLGDFARKSKFRDFYRNHRKYYDKLLETYSKFNPIQKMQNWLEDQFPMKYGNYKIIFSPLVGGAHSTQMFEDNGFKQTVMFVSRARPSKDKSDNVNEMLMSRVVFTEIDHNFVNPISDKYRERIGVAFKDREKWAAKIPATQAYGNPYKVFNEYMTWAVFTLYCYDNFSANEVWIVRNKMEKQMRLKRGFTQFKSFNRILLALYKNKKKGQKISALYPDILNWCLEQ